MRVYLDTSVFSALLDDRQPSRQALTQAFWDNRDQHQVVTGEIARQEISDNQYPELRSRMLSLLIGLDVINITPETLDILDSLMRNGPFTTRTADDAMHVAIAAANQVDVLLSWNFKHLVNQRRRLMVNNVLMSLGYPAIDILSPPEL